MFVRAVFLGEQCACGSSVFVGAVYQGEQFVCGSSVFVVAMGL